MKKLLFFATAAAVVLSSCTKDVTESTPIKGGNVAFTASFSYEDADATRTHADADTGAVLWDRGDVIGVNSREFATSNTPASTADSGATADFTVDPEDAMFLGSLKELFAYYPHDKANGGLVNVGVGETPEITLTIPTTQRYKEGSFYKMTVPGVAYIADYSQDKNLKFYSPVAFLKVPMVGYGTITSAMLSIGGQDIAGDGTVSYAALMDDEDDTVPALNLTTPADHITMVFGKGLELDYNAPKTLVFALAPGVNYSGQTVTIEVEGSEGPQTISYKIPVNGLLSEAGKARSIGNVSYGMTNKVSIDTVEEFLIYAYLNANGVDGLESDVKTEVTNLGYYDGISIYSSAIITANLDVAGAEITVGNPSIDPEVVENIAFIAKAWYLKNGKTIPTLESADVSGIKVGDVYTSISGLNIAGNVFVDSASKLNNITLTNLNIKDVEATAVNVLPALNVSSNWNNITINGGTLEGKAGAKYAVVDQTFTEYVPQVTVAAYPTANEAAIAFANVLKVNTTCNLTNIYAANNNAFGKIEGYAARCNITVDNLADVEAFMTNVIVKPDQDKWFSVISDGVSYWTGTVADDYNYETTTPSNENSTLTAEELAYAVLNTRDDIALTNDIDLRNLEWVLTSGAASINVSGENTIKNVNIKADASKDNTLFGANAAIDGITVVGLNIEAKAAGSATAFKVSGLALDGTVKNTVVENVTINVLDELNADSSVKTHATIASSVGAVLGKVTVNNIEDVTVNNVTINYPEDLKGSVSAGAVAGNLRITTGKAASLNKVTVSGNVIIPDNKLGKTAGAKVISYDPSKHYAYAAPFGQVDVSNAQIINDGKIKFILTVIGCDYGDKLAGGYTFSGTNIHNGTAQTVSLGATEEYDYQFNAVGANSGNQTHWDVISFHK